MTVITRTRINILGGVLVTGVLAGCGGSPPQTEVDTAHATFENAIRAEAAQYAAPLLVTARQAQNALDTELREQERRWFKSYDRTRQLATEATTTASQAAQQAMLERGRMEREAAQAKAQVARRAAAPVVVPRRIGGRIKAPIKIKDVRPTYPPAAYAARIGGTVLIEATVDTHGKVSATRVLKSVPLLDAAALDAVQKWEYRPTLVNGVPVPVVVTVQVNFVRS